MTDLRKGPLYLTNTLSRKKEEFVPIRPNHVGLYVCGPTVYDYSHIGHAKTYVGFDVIARYLKYSGFDVLYVQHRHYKYERAPGPRS